MTAHVGGRVVAPRHRPAGRPARPDRPARRSAGADGVCAVVFTIGRPVPAKVSAARPTTGVRSAPTSSGSPTTREDRVRRLAALARADGRQQLHPRLAARASPRRRARRATRSSRSRRPRPPGRRAIPEALAGIPVELRLRTLPGAHGWRTAWSRLGWPPAERWLGAVRRPALQRLDVPAATGRRCGRRRSTTSCRCTSRSG